MSGPIFGSGGTATGSSGGNRHIVEFRAGRMNMVDKMVNPDNRKGLVYMYQAEDSLIHFCWRDRTTNKVEDDLIIFPDDCEFLRVEACKTGRVYVLKFKSSSRRLFFWMQDAKSDKDEEWCRRVNEVMNNPQSASTPRSGEGGDLQYMLNNMSQQQLMQLFGGVGPMRGLGSLLGSMNLPSDSSSRNSSRSSAAASALSTAPAPTTAGSAAANPVTPTNQSIPTVTPQAPRATRLSTSASNDSVSSRNVTTGVDLATAIQNATGANAPGGATSDGSSKILNELQSFLSGMKTNEGESATGSGGHNVDLATAINAEAVSSIANDGARTETLLPHLPTIETGESTKQQLKDTVSSPQFQQALSTFSTALQSGQLGPVVSQFQLNDDAVAAANRGDLEQFVKALENKKDEEKETPMDEDKSKE